MSSSHFARELLASHYVLLRSRLRLDAPTVYTDEALLAFGPEPVEGTERAARRLNLSPRGDLIEAAANPFSNLRMMPCQRRRDDRRHAGAAHRVWAKRSMDRLRRAAAPR